MPEQLPDNVRHPVHYEIYEVQPIEITRFLGFCLGNSTKYVLRAPWKGGVEDCEKALQYLVWERETPQDRLSEVSVISVEDACTRLVRCLSSQEGDRLWRDMTTAQQQFIAALQEYARTVGSWPMSRSRGHLDSMREAVEYLKHILSIRYSSTKYAGMTGRPYTPEEE